MQNVESDGAQNGQIALEMVKKSFDCCPYKIVFMDVNMPIMGGLQATHEIREWLAKNHNSCPLNIVALTANETPEDR